jgi:hypothetical protein
MGILQPICNCSLPKYVSLSDNFSLYGNRIKVPEFVLFGRPPNLNKTTYPDFQKLSPILALKPGMYILQKYIIQSGARKRSLVLFSMKITVQTDGFLDFHAFCSQSG